MRITSVVVPCLLFTFWSAGCYQVAPEQPATTPTAMDTDVPPIPDNPIHPDDSLYVVTRPGYPLPIYYRRLATVTFADSAGGMAIRAFFAKYETQTVGGSPFMRSYTIQFPDPGPTWDAFEALLESMNLEAAVELAAPLVRTDLPVQLEDE